MLWPACRNDPADHVLESFLQLAAPSVRNRDRIELPFGRGQDLSGCSVDVVFPGKPCTVRHVGTHFSPEDSHNVSQGYIRGSPTFVPIHTHQSVLTVRKHTVGCPSSVTRIVTLARMFLGPLRAPALGWLTAIVQKGGTSFAGSV